MRLPALHWQILIALIAAVLVGWQVGPQPWLLESTSFVGTLFLNALKMVIVPLIMAAIISGLATATQGSTVGRMGLRTLLYYLFSGLAAILTGLMLVNLIEPGIIDGMPAGERLGLDASTGEVLAKVEGKGAGDLFKVLLQLFPPNIVKAAADGDMLGLIVFALLFGGLLHTLPKDLADTQARFWNGIYEVMTQIVRLVMMAAPLGVFALLTRTVAQTGWSAIEPLALFSAAVISGLLVHSLVTLPLILRFIARVNPLRHFRVMAPALATAFSTSSSAATMPVTMECLEHKGGVPRRVSGFVLPVGTTVNTDGTALYECAAALFIAQAYGLELGFGGQFLIVLTALLTSIGVAGIPSASLVAIAIILSAIGLPLEGIGLILAVDRILDMCRTTVNVLGDSVATVFVGRWEGEDGILGEPALNRH